MGMLYYAGSTEPISIDDVVLAHARAVISTKLRRNESFTLSWLEDVDGEPRRSTVWMNPTIPLRFSFEGAEPHRLDRELLQRMADAANTVAGMTLDDAPRELADAPARSGLREAA